MFRVLMVTTLVGAAWATSHYLTETSSEFGLEVPRAEVEAPAVAPSTRSVALLDLAVAALPGPEAEQPETVTGPAPAAKIAAVEDAAAKARPAAEVVDLESEERMARRLQTALRRVGCLKTRADGVWGPASRRAMQRFAERIDATLPTDRPDAVLLMLVERYEDKACGAPCVEGELPDAQGRCQAREEIAAVAPMPIRIASVGQSPSGAAADSEASLSVKTTALMPKVIAATPRVRTKVSRATRSKLPRVVRVKSRKTIWSTPAYGLGMSLSKAPAAQKSKRKRAGSSAAYRRWMKRSGVTMR